MSNTPITFVSFCVDIGRGELPETNSIWRHFALYESGMFENIQTNLPLVLYSSVNEIGNYAHRNETNFRHFYYNVDSIISDFPNFNLYEKNYPTSNKDVIATNLFYYVPLVVLKMKKMMEVVELNPFNSEYFFWMDCFFVRGMTKTDFLYDQSSYLSMFENVKNKLGNKFVLLDNGRRPFGFFWGGNKEVLHEMYKQYFDIFFEFLPNVLLTEELIFKKISERTPELINIVPVEDSALYKLVCQKFLTE